jgi:hypothetical protein
MVVSEVLQASLRVWWNNALTRAATRPPLRTSGIVNDGKYVNQINPHCIENTVGKPRQQGAPNSRQYFRIQKWHLLDALQLKLKRQLKFRPKPWALVLIPLVSLTDLSNGPARKLQTVRHDPFFSFDLTSSHE